MATKAKDETTEQTAPASRDWTKLTDEERAQLSDGTVGTAIQNATTMLTAKAKILADLQQARDFLGASVTMGVCNELQQEWIADKLPKRTRTKGDE